MKVIFIGPQGSGKGTQAKIVSGKLGVPHISTGDLLRNATGELKKDIDSYIVKGILYPDEKMLKVLEKRLAEDDCKKGFILDGFPRTLRQVEMLDNIIKIDRVIEIHISDAEAVRRLSGRVSCKDCGEPYNLSTKPPKKKDICDKCGGKLMRREDDKSDAIRKRLETYHRDTEVILEKYDSVRVDGAKDVEEVAKEILWILRR